MSIPQSPTARGRFWKKHVLTWRDSGLPQARYAKMHGLHPRTFFDWCRKFPSPASPPPEEMSRLQKEIVTLKARAEFLGEENRLLLAILYGKSSEKSKPDGPTPEQPLLGFDEVEVEPPAQEEPPAEKVAPCGCPLKRIGEKVSERLDIVPAKIQVIRTVRFKYAPQCQCATPVGAPGEVKIAPAPPRSLLGKAIAHTLNQ